MPFYAVRAGRKTGIFETWDECRSQVTGFNGAKFKKFATHSEALSYLSAGFKSSSTKFPLSSVLSSTQNNTQPPLNIDKAPKRLKATDSSEVDNLRPVAFMHDLNEANKVLVYTDGSCKGPLYQRRAGIGVFWGEGHPWNVSERLTGRQTNNSAEIGACIRAVQQAKDGGIMDLKIVTDSKFTINCVTKWYFKWKSNGWKLQNGSQVVNRVEVEQLVNELSMPGFHVSWCHIPGHSREWGNEQVDRLANAGADKPLPYPGAPVIEDANDEDIDDTDV